jgi:aarF domain-containing kinase
VTGNLRELLAGLPEEANQIETGAQAALQELLSKLSHKPVPVSRLARFWALGSMQAKIAAAYLVYWIRFSYASRDARERELNETHLKAALRLLGGMGYARGMIAKIGQAFASYPNILPAEFVDLLGKLHFEAPPMHYSLLREQVRNELNADPEVLFEEFDTRAFAAASLGQVHRAKLRTGEPVAVKIQYPNIARTIQADVRNLIALLTPMRLSKDWDNIREQIDDIRQMVEWETDYEREAQFIERARSVFSEDDGIVVPRVYPEISTKRVLTMDYLEGVHIDRYLRQNPSQEERNRFGALIMRSAFRIAHTARLWYADSNPGNFIFMKDGRLGVIDFGCCREFSEEEWDFYKEAARGFKEGGETLRRVMERASALQPGSRLDEEHLALLVAYGRWINEYIDYDGAFDFGNEAFIQRGIDLLTELTKRRMFRSLPVNTWINRLTLGLRALAYRLGARINVKKICDEESPGLFS